MNQDPFAKEAKAGITECLRSGDRLLSPSKNLQKLSLHIPILSL